MRPHDHVVGSPRPRNARPAAESTARDAVTTTETTMTGATAGITWRPMIHTGFRVIRREASTYGSFTTESACDRTMRVTSGHEKAATTRMIVDVLGPTSAATRIISGSTGSDSVRSTTTPMVASSFGT